MASKEKDKLGGSNKPNNYHWLLEQQLTVWMQYLVKEHNG